MNALDHKRLKHADSMIDKAEQQRSRDFNIAFRDFLSGWLLKCSVKRRNDENAGLFEIGKFLRELNHWLLELSSLEIVTQNKLCWLALAADDLEAAAEILKFEGERKDAHNFDVKINILLSSLFCIEKSDIEYTGTTSEERLFTDLRSLNLKEHSVLDGVSQYWISSKSRVFKNTIFEYGNLFLRGLENYQTAQHTTVKELR